MESFGTGGGGHIRCCVSIARIKIAIAFSQVKFDGSYSFFAGHARDRLVQPVASQFIKVKVKATNAVPNIADLKYK